MSILERLRVLDREATPAPWAVIDYGIGHATCDHPCIVDAVSGLPETATLICEVRNALPAGRSTTAKAGKHDR